jgi:hypothetical protein
MIKYLFLFFFLATGQATHAQVKGIVRDKDTGQPIPYASIWHEQDDKGTTAEPDGSFLFKAAGTENKNLVIAAAGYEKAMVPASQNMEIFLTPKPAVSKKKQAATTGQTRKKVIGNFRKSSIKGTFYGNDGTPYVLARFYPYDTSYAQTPFLNAVSLFAWSKIPQATFQLRVFGVQANGEPGEDLLPERLILTAPKGQRLITADLSSYRLPMPHQGLFIGFEWLVIEANKRPYRYTRQGGKVKHQAISYEPDLGITQEAGSERWMFIRGAWRRSSGQKQKVDAKLQFKLTLSD